MTIFPYRANVLAWTQFVGKQYGIIVVTVCLDTVNEMRERKNKCKY